METTVQEFATGEWVQVAEGRLRGLIGYVLRYDATDDEYKVRFTQNHFRQKISGSTWVDSDRLIKHQNYKDEDDLLAMIDLALDSKDEEWFKELTKQLPQELPF